VCKNSLNESVNRLKDNVRPRRLVAISFESSFDDEPVKKILTSFLSVSRLIKRSQPSINWISSKKR